MGAYTAKVAAANSLRTTALVKKKLANICHNFEDLDEYIIGKTEDVIGWVEVLEDDLEEIRRDGKWF